MVTKTNAGLVAYAIAQLGKPYWYGTYGKQPTEDLLIAKAKQYPSHYSSKRLPTYRSHIGKYNAVHDCVGLIKGYYWLNESGKIVYELDDRPDTSADGMKNKCKEKGSMNTMPDIPGILVFSPGHVGVYIGNGDVVEARGFAYGVVKTRLRDRPWTSWGKCPYIDYFTATEPAQPPNRPTLRKGDKSPDVGTLQSLLTAQGFPLKIDSDFGKLTQAAVMQYQASRGLAIDGIVGAKTWAALLSNTPAIKMGYVRIVGDVNETRGQTLIRELEAVGHQAEWVEHVPDTNVGRMEVDK